MPPLLQVIDDICTHGIDNHLVGLIHQVIIKERGEWEMRAVFNQLIPQNTLKNMLIIGIGNNQLNRRPLIRIKPAIQYFPVNAVQTGQKPIQFVFVNNQAADFPLFNDIFNMKA